MEKHFNFNIYKFATFVLILIFFTPLSVDAFQNKEWLRMFVMAVFSIIGLYGSIETITKKSSKSQKK